MIVRLTMPCSQIMYCFYRLSLTLCLNQQLLLGVTQQCHASQRPVVRVGHVGGAVRGLQAHGCDVREVCTSWLLVYRACVELVVALVVISIDSVEVYHGEGCEQDLGLRLHQLAALAVPACSVQVQSVHIYAFKGWGQHFLFHHLCDIIVEDNRIQCPALMCSCHFLPHCSQEALGVKEASHPEYVWAC